MTTNGLLLDKLAQPLKDAGLKRVNIHLDSLNTERAKQLMRFLDPEAVWRGVKAAEAAGLTPVKMNAVVARGYNDDDVVELARLTLEHDWQMRFIELMPLGATEPKKLAVVEACSGIRSLMTLVTLAVIYAYFTTPKSPDAKRLTIARSIILVLSAVPIAILTNAVRVK